MLLHKLTQNYNITIQYMDIKLSMNTSICHINDMLHLFKEHLMKWIDCNNFNISIVISDTTNTFTSQLSIGCLLAKNNFLPYVFNNLKVRKSDSIHLDTYVVKYYTLLPEIENANKVGKFSDDITELTQLMLDKDVDVVQLHEYIMALIPSINYYINYNEDSYEVEHALTLFNLLFDLSELLEDMFPSEDNDELELVEFDESDDEDEFEFEIEL